MNTTLQQIFNQIYATNAWDCGSGIGSAPFAVIPYIQFLSAMIERYNVRSVVDLGCGDWSFSRFLTWDRIRYLGVDISDIIIKANTEKFSKPNVTFLCGEISDVPDLDTYDMVIMKDMLQHLSLQTASTLLGHCKKVKYLLITNDDTNFNKDIKDGEGYPRNMKYPPFNLTVTDEMRYVAPTSTKVSQLIIQP